MGSEELGRLMQAGSPVAAGRRRHSHTRHHHAPSGSGSERGIRPPVGTPALGVSAEAAAFLTASGAKLLQMRPITLCFEKEVEGQYLADVAKRRWPVLIFIFCFDVGCYLLRVGAKLLAGHPAAGAAQNAAAASPTSLIGGLAPQLANMAMCWMFLLFVNRRSRRLGDRAARQEEFLLAGLMALTITSLLASLGPHNGQDYVLACFFLICTTSFMKIRWFVGTAMQAVPVVLGFQRHGLHGSNSFLPSDAVVHIFIAWGVGALMSFLSDTYRRQMFANHRLAFAAAEMEVHEAKARLHAQNQLAAAQAQAAQRALVVAREKAANEAKSEFMSLMCHEVRTPLNGCLASAEMLLETVLQAEQRELAKTIRVSGSILLSTVSNFLDFFKMEAGKSLDIVRTEVDIQELVSDVHCIIDAMIGKESGVGLLCPSTEGVPDVVLGDPDRLRGILLNLYTNAAKFTRRGAIALRVSIAGPDYRPMPSEALYGKGNAEDLARSYGGGDTLTAANLVTSEAQRAAADQASRQHASQDSNGSLAAQGSPGGGGMPRQVPQTFQTAPARSSGGSATSSAVNMAQAARQALLGRDSGDSHRRMRRPPSSASIGVSLQEWLPDASASSISGSSTAPPPSSIDGSAQPPPPPPHQQPQPQPCKLPQQQNPQQQQPQQQQQQNPERQQGRLGLQQQWRRQQQQQQARQDLPQQQNPQEQLSAQQHEALASNLAHQASGVLTVVSTQTAEQGSSVDGTSGNASGYSGSRSELSSSTSGSGGSMPSSAAAARRGSGGSASMAAATANDVRPKALQQAGQDRPLSQERVSQDVLASVREAESQLGGDAARPVTDRQLDAQILVGRLQGLSAGAPGPISRMGEANGAEKACRTHRASEAEKASMEKEPQPQRRMSGLAEMMQQSWQAATDGAEFMTAALARRCASFSQLKHAALSWGESSAGSGFEKAAPQSTGSRSISGTYATADSRRSSIESGSEPQSARVSFELGSQDGRNQRSLDTILGPRRSSGARRSTEQTPGQPCLNGPDQSSVEAARRSFDSPARRSLEAAARRRGLVPSSGRRSPPPVPPGENLAAADVRRSFEGSAAVQRSLEAARRSLEARSPPAGRQPRLSWDQAAELRTTSGGILRMPSGGLRTSSFTVSDSAGGGSARASGGTLGSGAGRRPAARVSFDRETTRTDSEATGSNIVSSVLSMSSFWNQAGSSDRRSSGSGGRLKGRRPSGDGGAAQSGRRRRSGNDSPAVSLSESTSSNGMDALMGDELPAGWASVVSRPSQNAVMDTGAPPMHWLVFEVMDTGVGIAERGLRSLFKEYVQGSEEEMRRPRSRGGTGLGLSICSKQVAVLGGQIGAMSKQGLGSTFWFTVPLQLPEPPGPVHPLREPAPLRRTASWSSSDAFTDGHYGSSQDSMGRQRKRSGSDNITAVQRSGYAMDDAAAPEGGGMLRSPSALRNRLRSKSCPTVRLSREAHSAAAKANSNSGSSSMPNPRTEASLAREVDAAAAVEQARSLQSAFQQPQQQASPASGSPAAAAGQNPLQQQQQPNGSAEIKAAASSGGDPEEKAAEDGSGGGGSAPADAVAASALASGPFAAARRASIEHLLQQKPASPPVSLPPSVPEGAAVNDTSMQLPRPSAAPNGSGSSGGIVNGSSSNLATWSWASLGSEHSNHTFNRSAEAAKARGMRASMEARRRRLDFSALQGKRVLLAEDNLINQTVAKKMLSQMGMVAVVAANGAEAVDAVTAPGAHFDVVLMDMAMPVMGGVSATKNIRGRGLEVPIVAMTANASDKDRDECLDAGMDGFLSKPVLKDRLAEALLLVLSGRGAYHDATVKLASLHDGF